MLRELNDLRGSEPAMRSVRNATIEAITVTARMRPSVAVSVCGDPMRAYAVAVPYLHLCGRVLGGALLARSAAIATRRLAEPGADSRFYRSKLQTARFYAEYLLPETLSLAAHGQVGWPKCGRGGCRTAYDGLSS